MKKDNNLTEKEVIKLKDAASTVRKFAKYIQQVNDENRSLRKNLDEAIKAGDVTNAQKVDLASVEAAEKEYHKLIAIIQEKCRRQHPGCRCEQEKHDTCEIFQEFIVAEWMRGVSRGSIFDWPTIFDYACVGRKQWVKQNLLRGQKVSW